eukprot:6179760-Pleurochrysis_carterae.AAC.3
MFRLLRHLICLGCRNQDAAGFPVSQRIVKLFTCHIGISRGGAAMPMWRWRIRRGAGSGTDAGYAVLQARLTPRAHFELDAC